MIADADVTTQLEELRSTVEALKAALAAQPRVTVRAVEPASYLGQSVALVATVTLGDGVTPAVGVPVTLVTAFGVLRGADDLVEGGSLTGLTGADGTLRATLRPQVSLETNEDHDALEAALSDLDVKAPSPAAALASLQSFANRYRLAVNRGLRAAVDAYFAEFGEGLLRGEGLATYMAAWPQVPATVVAYATPDGSPGTIAATVTIMFRDWLGPWLEVYKGLTGSDLERGVDLDFVKRTAQTPAGLIAGVFDRVGLLVDDEYGRIGKWLAGQAAERVIDRFLDTGIADLPEATRVAVVPMLNTGVRALVSAGPSVLGALGQAHAANAVLAGVVATKVDAADFAAALLGKASVGDLQAVQSLVATKADANVFATFQSQTLATLATKVDVPAFNNFQAQNTATLGTKVDATTFGTFRQENTAALATKVSASTFTAFQQQNTAALATKVDATTFSTFQQTNTAALATKVDTNTFSTFQQQTTAALATKLNVATFNAFQQTNTAALATKVDTNTFSTFQQQTATALGTKVDVNTFNTFQTQNTAAIATKVDASTFSTFQQQTATALGTKLNASTFSAFQTQNTAALARKVDDGEFALIKTRVTTLERR
jgi:hypothetical protein